MIDKLQDLVSTDGRFKNMREALRWLVFTYTGYRIKNEY